MSTIRGHRRPLFETAGFSLLSVALYTAFPQFSDINTLWFRDRGFQAYEDLPVSFEYPPLAALLWRPLTQLPDPRLAVLVNGLVMAVVAVGVTWLLLRITAKPVSDLGLWVLSPALIMFLPINWDVAAVFLMVAALLLLARDHPGPAGASLGAGVSLKVFPGALALPLLPLIPDWRRRWKWLVGGGIVVAVSYAGYALARPETWRAHLDFASSRTDYETTIWGGLDVLLGWFGVDLALSTINLLALVATGAGLVAVTIWVGRRKPAVGEAAFVAIATFIFFNKVFKPQYVLWLLPFAALVGSRRVTIRSLEGAAIVELVAIYTAPLAFLFPVVTAIRLVCLGTLGWDVVRSNR